MSKVFDKAVISIIQKDSRFDPGAYLFLKTALDFTMARIAENNAGIARHVSGAELLEGFRDCALDLFGPMAYTVLREWGVLCCEHVGEMVFFLIEAGVFGKQESDTQQDFNSIYDFETALLEPFVSLKSRSELVQNVKKPSKAKK